MGSNNLGTAEATSRTILTLPGNITLQEWQHSHAASISRHGNSRAVWDNLRNRMPHPYTEEAAKDWIDFNLDVRNHVRTGPWTPAQGATGPAIPVNYAIVIDGEAAGGIGLDFREDVNFRCAELGYWLGERFWRRGIMSRVVPAFVDWTWATFGILIRLDSGHYERNENSGKVLRKAGFEYEGRRPDSYVKNGEVGAEIMYGALRPKKTA